VTRVAVVVPVHDDAVRLARCLAALAAQTHRAEEVLVVDDGSREPVRAPDGVRVLRAGATSRGSYAARNAGVAATRADVVAFTDADCLPAPDWLERGLAALDGADRVAGPVEVVPRGRRPGAVELYDARTAFPQEHFVRAWGFGATANLLVRRAVLDAVGPFDVRLRSGGDADWGQRATAAGFGLRYAPDVVVRHPARATLAELAEKTVRTARGVEHLGLLRDEVTPLPEAVRRHLAGPAGRLREAGPLPAGDVVRFIGVALLAAGLGAGEVLRGRAARRLAALLP
jgi:glycosyltransferase involved in cell wall biosynthesis